MSVTVLDRLPAPYGLVRYGVAPDHVKMKSVIRVLQQPFSDAVDGADVEFLGDVPIGDGGVPVEALREHFDAVIHATGSPVDRRPRACRGRTWTARSAPARSSAGTAATRTRSASTRCSTTRSGRVGAGNVALDVARVLARSPDEMAETDVPDPVLAALRASAVTDVHVLIRRGPQHVRFTPAELRQIGELSGVEVIVHDDGLLARGVDEPAERRQRQNLTILTEWAARELHGPTPPHPPALPAQPGAAARRP